MAKIICVNNQKGGVGKSTTAAILAQGAAYKGKKVLAIDLDPQANLSLALGAINEAETKNSYQVISGHSLAVGNIVHTEQGIDVIPASKNLVTLKSDTGSAHRLSNAIQKEKRRYDVIVIDTPSKSDELQYNALQAATGLLIPQNADIYNLQALIDTIKTARKFQESNPALKILGFILTEYSGRTKLDQQIKNLLVKAAGSVPYLGAIRKAVAVKEAAALQLSLYEYAPNSKPAQDYLNILNQII